MTRDRPGEPADGDAFAATDKALLARPAWHAQAVDACWALAARDAAIENGDKPMATRFAAEARQAIAGAVDAGATPAELARELDYPGGHDAMDGPHIDHQITELPTRIPTETRAPSPTTALSAAVAAATAATNAGADAARQEQLTRWHQDGLDATAAAELDRGGLDDEWGR